MDSCSTCEIGRKLTYCCSSHPTTGKSTPLTLRNGREVSACPSLDRDGYCTSISDRPDICREYRCPGHDDRRA